jgi:hypothetical protein
VVATLKDGETGEPIHKRKWDSSVMDLPVVNQKEQRRPSLRVSAISQLVKESEGEEQALCVLLAATGMRIPEHPLSKRTTSRMAGAPLECASKLIATLRT